MEIKVQWKIWVCHMGRYEEKTEEIKSKREEYGFQIKETREEWYLFSKPGYFFSGDAVMKKTWLAVRPGGRAEVWEEQTEICISKIFFQRREQERAGSYTYFVELKKEGVLNVGGEHFSHIKIQTLLFSRRWMEICWERGRFWVSGNTWDIFHNGDTLRDKTALQEHDFLEIGEVRFYFKRERLYFDMDETIQCSGIGLRVCERERTDYPDYMCRIRWKEPYPVCPVTVIWPENFPAKKEGRLFPTLFSSLGMVLVMLLLQNKSGRSAGMERLIFGMMAILTAVVTWGYGKLDTLRRQRKYIRQYRAYLREKETFLKEKRAEERSFLEKYEQSWREHFKQVQSLSWRLFEKSPEDWDFLCVRLGEGEGEPRTRIQFQRKEEIEGQHVLWKEAEEMITRQNKMESAPIVLDLRVPGELGIVGREGEEVRLLEMILFETACSHSEEDVRIAVLGTEELIQKISWLRFLPHIQRGEEGRWIGWDRKSRDLVTDLINSEIARRVLEKRKTPAWVVCCLEESIEETHGLAQHGAEAVSCGIYPIFLKKDERELPRGCSAKICVEGNRGTIFFDGVGKQTEFAVDFPEREMLEKASRILAAARQKKMDKSWELPKKLTLSELMEKEGTQIWELKKRWCQERETLPVPIGVTEGGELFYLDIHEKVHGPHGLAAGTTGSGKSEMMLTYLLCAALFFPPWRLQFLIIDFKGGGLAGQLKGLPHLAGVITNLEEAFLERSLLFIRAELKKRQRILSEFRCAHVDEYEKIYRKQQKELQPMPHLILIVDEFAELKAEQPEFMKELISASRIGRSLGIHLILATQKPSGQVSEQIFSNAKFRICLKVQSENDSREVLHSPLAAQIREVGRGYFQVGNQEVFWLFQAAYSSERKAAGQGGFQIFRILLGGERVPFYEKKKGKAQGRTQAEEIRCLIEEQWRKQFKRPLPTVCMEPLREEIFYPQERIQKEKWRFPIGIYDNPQMQCQPEAILEMKEKNLLVTGSMGYGKQNLFFVVLRAMAEQNGEEIEIYLADFECRIPKILEELPQMGGIIYAEEEEKLENLIEMIEEEILFRKQQRGFAEQEKGEMIPIILVWFSYVRWKKRYPELEERIATIWKEGIRFGIYTMIFQEETSGIGQLLSDFGCRIALYHQDTSIYRQMIDGIRGKLPPIPGRGFFEKEHEVYQMQIYLAFRGKTKKEQQLKLEDWIWEGKKKTKKQARAIPFIPKELSWETYPICRRKGDVPAAIKFKRLQAVFWSEWKGKITGICGEGQAGWIAQIPLTWQIFQEKLQLFVLDDERGGLQYLNAKKGIYLYTKNREEIFNKIEERRKDREETVLLILNGMSVITEISQEEIQYHTICRLAKEIVILCTNLENRMIRYQSPRLLQEIKERGQILFFGEKSEIKLVEIPFGEIKRCKERKQESEIFYWNGSHLEKWKVALERENNPAAIAEKR